VDLHHGGACILSRVMEHRPVLDGGARRAAARQAAGGSGATDGLDRASDGLGGPVVIFLFD